MLTTQKAFRCPKSLTPGSILIFPGYFFREKIYNRTKQFFLRILRLRKISQEHLKHWFLRNLALSKHCIPVKEAGVGLESRLREAAA